MKMIVGLSALVGLLGLVGCDTGLDSVASGGTETCVPTLSGSSCNGNVVESCANSSGGWYEVNGSRVCSFTTSATSCASFVVDQYCSRPEARTEMIDLLSAKSETLELQNQVTDLMNVMNRDIVDSQQAE